MKPLSKGDVTRIMEKENPTGRELGILEVENMCQTYKMIQAGELVQCIYPAGEFEKKVAALKGERNIKTYRGYLNLHQWISTQYFVAQTNFQSALHFHMRLTSCIREALLAHLFITALKEDESKDLRKAEAYATAVAVSAGAIAKDEDQLSWISECSKRLSENIDFIRCHDYLIDKTAKILGVPSLKVFKCWEKFNLSIISEYNVTRHRLIQMMGENAPEAFFDAAAQIDPFRWTISKKAEEVISKGIRNFIPFNADDPNLIMEMALSGLDLD